MSFIVSMLVTTLATAAAIWLVPGITAMGGGLVGPIVAALMLAVVNALVRPIVQAVSAPVNVLTLGLFSFVVNALMLMLVSWLSTSFFGVGIHVDGFWSALFGSLIISTVTTVLGVLTGSDAAREMA